MKLARTQDWLIASENDTILLLLHGKGTLRIGPVNSTFGREERDGLRSKCSTSWHWVCRNICTRNNHIIRTMLWANILATATWHEVYVDEQKEIQQSINLTH